MTHRRPAPPLTPLEEQLDRLLVAEIERQDRGETQMPDYDAAVIRLHRALADLVRAVEDVMREDAWDSDHFDHYEQARAALGCPVETFPGGPEGEHFHWLDYDEENDPCAYCEDAARAKEEAASANPSA